MSVVFRPQFWGRRFMCLFQAGLDTCLDSPFLASLSVHGLCFTVYAPSTFETQRKTKPFEGRDKLFDRHPFVWKTLPPHQAVSGPQKSIFVLLFFVPESSLHLLGGVCFEKSHLEVIFKHSPIRSFKSQFLKSLGHNGLQGVRKTLSLSHTLSLSECRAFE